MVEEIQGFLEISINVCPRRIYIIGSRHLGKTIMVMVSSAIALVNFLSTLLYTMMAYTIVLYMLYDFFKAFTSTAATLNVDKHVNLGIHACARFSD